MLKMTKYLLAISMCLCACGKSKEPSKSIPIVNTWDLKVADHEKLQYPWTRDQASRDLFMKFAKETPLGVNGYKYVIEKLGRPDEVQRDRIKVLWGSGYKGFAFIYHIYRQEKNTFNKDDISLTLHFEPGGVLVAVYWNSPKITR